jgi:hypothetical protein
MSMTKFGLLGLVVLIGDAGEDAARRIGMLRMTAEGKVVDPHAEPLLNYTDPTRDTKGTVWAWGAGRPAVLLTLTDEPMSPAEGPANGRVWYHEFVSLADAKLQVTGGKDWSWRPKPAPPRMLSLSTTTVPAESERARGRQMRLLARRFAASESYQGETYELRLLDTPILRYSDPNQKLIDGALFAFAHGTNPEVVLLLEAERSEDGPRWRYGFARMSEAALSVTLEGRNVWSAEPFQGSNRNTAEPYNTFREAEFSARRSNDVAPR